MIAILILVLLFRALAKKIDITASCDLTFCQSFQIANGVCDKACMVPACLYDSPSVENFYTSDCYSECLALGCKELMLNNGICDSQCNFYQCGWDLGDCGYCSSQCTKELLTNDVCDEVCAFSQCAFDNNACGYCAKGCFYEDLLRSDCLPQCSFKECYDDSSPCLKPFCSPSCILSQNNDGICNPACNTPACNYDFGDCSCPSSCLAANSSSTCQRKNGRIEDECSQFSCQFKDGLCGSCAEDCFADMLGNGFCDSACNNKACGFDRGDCGCALNCSVIFNKESKEFEDSKSEGCKSSCLVESCEYGTSFCSDFDLIKTAVLTSQVFDDFYRKPDLSYCFCEAERAEKMIDGSFVCDRNDECYVQACLYCFGSNDQIKASNCLRGFEDKCFVCKDTMIKNLCIEEMTKCPLAFKANSKLSHLFADGPALWCLEDPIYFTFNYFLEIHVNTEMIYKYRDFGEGSAEKPFNSLHFALMSANAPYTKIYIESSINDLTFDRILFSPFIDDIYSPLETNIDLGQQELWIIGKSQTGEVPVVYIRSNFRFVPRFLKTFIVNLNFSGKNFFALCLEELCQYCKYFNSESGWFLDDRGQNISFETLSNFNLICFKFQTTNVFEFRNRAFFENVTFSEMRYQFNALIKSNSTLEMVGVKFIKLQPSPNGGIIIMENIEMSQRASLSFTRGEVTDLGAGYENIANIITGSFLIARNLNSLLIENVNFSFNFVFSSIQSTSTNYLIYLKDFNGTVQIKDSTFSNNYLNYLIYVDVQSLEYEVSLSTQDFLDSKYQKTHFSLKNCIFLNNYCSEGLLFYSMSLTLQNIELSQIQIKGSTSGKDGLITIVNSRALEAYEIQGGFVDVLINSTFYQVWLEKRTFTMSEVSIQDSFIGGNAICLEGLANVKVENLVLKNIKEGSKEDIMNLIKFFTDSDRYLSLIDDQEVPYMNCSDVVLISSCSNVFFNDLMVSKTSCSANQASAGLSIQGSVGTVQLARMEFFQVQSSSSKGMLLNVQSSEQVQISELLMRECKNNLFSLVFISLTPVVYASKVTGKDLDSMYSAVFLVSESLQVNLTEFSFENSEASFSEGGCISLIASIQGLSASVSDSKLLKCKAINSVGGGFHIDGASLDSEVVFQLINVSFTECSANEGGIIYVSSMISFSSSEVSSMSQVSVDSCRSDQGGNIALNHRRGNLTISNIRISNCSGTDAGVAGYFTEGLFSLKIENFQVFDSDAENIFSFKSSKIMSSVSMENILVRSCKSLVFDLDFFNLTCFNLTVTNSTSALVADMNSAVHLQNATFVALEGVVAVVSKETTFLCEDCLIKGNNGSLIIASGSSSVSLKRSSVVNNRFDRDFAFQLSEGFHFMQNVDFFDNLSEIFGIFSVINLKISFISCNFFNNVVKNSNLVVLAASDSFVEISSSYFKQEKVSIGSYLMFTINNVVQITECDFYNSSAEFPTVLMNQGKISIKNSNFLQNSGQVLRSTSSEVQIFNSKFQSLKLDLQGNPFIIEVDSGNFSADSVIMTGFRLAKNIELAAFIYLSKVTQVKISASLFTGSDSQFLAVYSRESSEVLMIDSTFKGFKSELYSCVTLISFSEATKCVVKSLNFMNNTSQNLGGALYAENVDLQVIDSNFSYNFARVRGGAISYLSPYCKSCTFSIEGSSFFSFNYCDGQGGAIYWDDFKPNINHSVYFTENYAEYGQDIASKPASLGGPPLVGGSIIKQENYISEYDEVPAGQKLIYPIEIYLRDTYNFTVSDDNSSYITVSTQATNESEANLVSLSGTTEYVATEGVFTIDDISIFGVPGSSVGLMVITKAIQPKQVRNDETFYSSSAWVLIRLRKCVKGETPYDNRCSPCPKNQFSLKNDSDCEDCPNGADCPGGSALIVKPGYWRSSLASDIIEKCIPAEACLQGNSSNELGDCSAGYTGKFCQSCLEGYSKTVSSVCSKCPNDQNNKLTAVLIFLMFLVFCILLVKTTLKSAFTSKSIQSIYIKILINYIQLIFITTQINILWPTYLDSAVLLQRSAATLSERIFSLDCYISTGSNVSSYYYKLVLFALVPLAIFFTCSVFWTGFGFYRESNIYVKRENFTSIIVLFFLIYPNILRAMLSHFLCRDVDKFGLYLNENTLIVCWQDDHLKYSKNLVVPSIIVWGFAVPTFILVYMVKIRKKLHIDQNRIVFGYLCNGFKQRAFYWEFVILYRKVFLISIAVFLSLQATMVQALTMIIALIFSVYFQYSQNPYNKKELNEMEIKSLLIATVTIYSSLYFLPESIPQVYIVIVSFLIVTGNSYFLFSWIFFMGKALLDILVKALPGLRYRLKKGDAFEEEFNVEEITRPGVFYDRDENKMYSFIHRNHFEDFCYRGFEIESLKDVFFQVFLNEKDELE